MKDFLHWVLMPCSEATLSIEKKYAKELNPFEKVRLKGHLLICKCCKAYDRKVNLMDKILHEITIKEEGDSLSELDLENLKEKLKVKLKN